MKLTFKHFLNFAFFWEVFLFAFSLLLAISTALNFINSSDLSRQISSTGDFGLWQFILIFLIATVILLLILKYFKKQWLIKTLFYLAIFEGLLIFTQSYFAWPEYLYILIFLLIFWFFYRNILVHDLIMILAIAAIAVIFGLNFTPSSAVILLLFLAVYDYWAVYKTKHMVQMFRGMAESKVHFSLVIPANFRGLFNKIKDVSPTTEFMFLGTGDVALPAIFIVASLKINIMAALISALGAILGLIILHIVFISQKQRAPMPGLPPIVFGTLLGFLISFLL